MARSHKKKGLGMNLAYQRDGFILHEKIALMIDANRSLEDVVRAIEAGDKTIAAIAMRTGLTIPAVLYRIRVIRRELAVARQGKGEQQENQVASYGSIIFDAFLDIFSEADRMSAQGEQVQEGEQKE